MDPSTVKYLTKANMGKQLFFSCHELNATKPIFVILLYFVNIKQTSQLKGLYSKGLGKQEKYNEK